MKAIMRTALLSGFALATISCGNPFVANENNSVSVFRHAPSAKFFKDGYYESKELLPFRHGDILTTVSLGHHEDSDTYTLWGSFFSSLTGQSVEIKSVSFSNGETILEKTLDETIFLDKDFKGLKQKGIRLIENIGRDFFGEEQDDFSVRITFSLGVEIISQDYVIKRKRIGIPIH